MINMSKDVPRKGKDDAGQGDERKNAAATQLENYSGWGSSGSSQGRQSNLDELRRPYAKYSQDHPYF